MITLGYVGVQPSSYPINTIFLWTGGSHEGVLQVALKPRAPAFVSTDFEETLRRRFARTISGRAVLVRARRHRQPHHELRRADAGRSRDAGPGFRGDRAFATKVRDELARIPALRDLQSGRRSITRPSRSPSIARWPANSASPSIRSAARSPPPPRRAGSSRRTTGPIPRTGIAFQVQVEVPQPRMTTLDDLRVVPVSGDRGSHAAARRRGARIDNAHDRRRIRPHQRAADGHAVGERRGRGPRARRGHGRRRRSPAPARRRAAPRSRCAARLRAMRETFANITAGLRRGGRRDLSAARRELSVAAARLRRRLDRAGRPRRASSLMLAATRNDAERAVVHGRDHGHRRRGRERDSAGDVRGAGAPARDVGAATPPSTPRARACGRC